MNIKLIALTSIVAASMAFAQYDDDEYEEETTTSQEESSEPAREEASEPAEEAPAPAPAPAVAEESSSSFTEETQEASANAPATGLSVLHGSAYNRGDNQAAASTYRGNMASPYLMAGTNAVYVEPTTNYGAAAFTNGSMTYLVAFDNSLNLGMLTAGIATKTFGVTLNLALGKIWVSEETSDDDGKVETDASLTKPGDVIGATFAAPFGGIDLTVDAFWRTHSNDVDVEESPLETNSSMWDLGANVTLSNTPSNGPFYWGAGAQIVRHESSTETEGVGASVEVVNNDAYFALQPFFNFGMAVASKEDMRIFLGLNTRVPIIFYDEIENKNANTKDSYSDFGIYTTPNLLGELQLSENWIVYGGAAFEWQVMDYAGEEFSSEDGKDEISFLSMQTNATMAFAGARFQYKRLVLEASIADQLNTNAWSGLIGNFSGMINF